MHVNYGCDNSGTLDRPTYTYPTSCKNLLQVKKVKDNIEGDMENNNT